MFWSIKTVVSTAGVRDELSQNTSARILEEELIAATTSLFERIIVLLYSVCWQQDEGWKCGTSVVVTRFSLKYCCMPLPVVVAQVRKHSTGRIHKETERLKQDRFYMGVATRKNMQQLAFLHRSFLETISSLSDKS